MAIKQQSTFTIIGPSARTSNAREITGKGEIGRLWSHFPDAVGRIPNQIGDETVALYCDYENGADGDYTFVLGKKVSSSDLIPTGMVAKTVPAGRYAVFTSGKGPLTQVVPQLWLRIWKTPAEQLGGSRLFLTDYEIYDARAADPVNGQVEIYVGIR